MIQQALPRDPSPGRLLDHLLRFARVLRSVGLPIGTGRVLEAVRALEVVGITRRDDFYWALHAVFVGRGEQRELFDQAFRAFWRELGPELEGMVADLPAPRSRLPAAVPEQARRVREAMAGKDGRAARESEGEARFDATLTYSDREILRGKDFEQMSLEELERAKAVLRSLRLPIEPVRTRRYRSSRRGHRIDMRSTLRASLRSGGGIPLRRRERTLRPPPLVTICDISGSMERYSRLLLHFLHGVAGNRERVHTFLFGTRLTNVTRLLAHRDVDEALARVGEAVRDWSGGTRIGASLESFNLLWSRRVLGQGAIVLLITDGLDREGGRGLAAEVARLKRSCRRLIWLNPLLRYEDFEPKASGIRAILPHVDEFRPVHNLESLEDLAAALAKERRANA